MQRLSAHTGYFMSSYIAFFYISLMAYVLAFCHAALSFFFAHKYFRIMCNFFVGVGLVINIHEFCTLWVSTGQFPSSTVYDFMLLLSAAFAATYFIINIKIKSNVIGLFILPFPIVFSILAAFAPVGEPPQFVESVWRYGHLPFIILGTTFFIAAFLSAAMYLIQERQLRSKSFGVVFRRFPSLDAINKMNDMALKVGFYFFSIGAILGFIWMLKSGSGGAFATLKIIFSLITWAVFAFIMVIKARKGMPPRKMALLTVAGFLSVVITYIGVAVFLSR